MLERRFINIEMDFFHGKVTIIDGEIVDIGTANFDNRSFYLNCESNCIIYDKNSC